MLARRFGRRRCSSHRPAAAQVRASAQVPASVLRYVVARERRVGREIGDPGAAILTAVRGPNAVTAELRVFGPRSGGFRFAAASASRGATLCKQP